MCAELEFLKHYILSPRAEAQRWQSTEQLREAESREGIREVEKGKVA